jgi:hypothetical protein
MRGVQGLLFLVLKPLKSFQYLSEKSPVLDKYHVPYFNENQTVSRKDRKLKKLGTGETRLDAWVGWG